MWKEHLSSLGSNELITGTIIKEEKTTWQDKLYIIPLETACGNQLKWLLEYEKFKSYLWTGPYMGVGFERKLLLLPVYVLCTIYFDLNIDLNNLDEPCAAFISATSLVWIVHHWNMNILPTKKPWS